MAGEHFDDASIVTLLAGISVLGTCQEILAVAVALYFFVRSLWTLLAAAHGSWRAQDGVALLRRRSSSGYLRSTRRRKPRAKVDVYAAFGKEHRGTSRKQFRESAVREDCVNVTKDELTLLRQSHQNLICLMENVQGGNARPIEQLLMNLSISYARRPAGSTGSMPLTNLGLCDMTHGRMDYAPSLTNMDRQPSVVASGPPSGENSPAYPQGPTSPSVQEPFGLPRTNSDPERLPSVLTGFRSAVGSKPAAKLRVSSGALFYSNVISRSNSCGSCPNTPATPVSAITPKRVSSAGSGLSSVESPVPVTLSAKTSRNNTFVQAAYRTRKSAGSKS
jgi:hypothetical protein